jgi:hypothetical protein
MYRIRELPVLQNGADRAVSSAAEHDDPPDYSDTFYERRYQYAWLGLKTIILSRRLRNLAQLLQPASMQRPGRHSLLSGRSGGRSVNVGPR